MRTFRSWAFGLFLKHDRTLAGASIAVLLAAALGPAALADEQAQREAIARVVEYAEDSHYLNIRVDDRVSRATLENYVASLDEFRLLFTQEDEAHLREQYGDRLDDAMRQGQVEPVFEIHRLYLQRQAQFRDFAMEYLSTRPSLNTSREWLLNRYEAPRPRNRDEQQQLWKDWVRHEWIDLVLEGWTYESSRARLRHRYLFGNPLGVGREGFSIVIGELPGARQPGSEPYDPWSAFALFLGAFARALDSDSSYASPESVWELAERMEDVGQIRVALSPEGEYAAVREHPEEVHAAAAGELQIGDRIIEVDPFGDGEFIDVVGWPIFQLHNLLLGPTGTRVAFGVLPAGVQTGAVERTMKRTSMVTKEMKRGLRWTPKWLMDRNMNKWRQSQMKASKAVLVLEADGRTLRVGVVRIPAVYEKCARDVRRLVRELKAEGVNGLVLDLRNNFVGESDEVTSLAGLFVGKGPISQERDRKGKVRVQRNTRQEAIWDGPLAVLVNHLSSLDAEIFSAAIQDYGRGVVVGDRTFARGTRQVEFKIKALARDKADDPVLGVTSREVFRVTGESLDHSGVRADVLLTMADEYSSPDRTGTRGDLRPLNAEASTDTAAPREIPAADFRGQELTPELLDTLSLGHQKRAAQDPEWRLIAGNLELSRDRMRRQTEPIHLDMRRANREAEWAEELALARAWVDAKGPEAGVVDPALADFFRLARGVHVPEGEESKVEEPELVRAIMLAKGYVVVEGEGGYQQSDYDLPLQQAAGIVADWVRLTDGAGSVASASGGYPAADRTLH